MSRSHTVVLKLPLSAKSDLDQFVKDCLNTGVRLIAVSGVDAADVEEDIDQLIVGDGSKNRFVVTSSHLPEEDAISFARLWNGGSEVTVVTL
jgi:hypothetical protein